VTTRKPPRFVPTLTEVVQAGQPQEAAGASEERLVQRVLQRIDLVLERRLREAIATVVLAQTSTLAPALREQIEAMVREAVAQALAEEQGATGEAAARPD
jgi:hypothetical protein